MADTNQFLYSTLGNEFAYNIVCPSSGKDHLWDVVDFLCLMGQGVRIYTNAVPADKPWLELEKIPLCACSRLNIISIDTQMGKYQNQFILQSIIIPLGALYY